MTPIPLVRNVQQSNANTRVDITHILNPAYTYVVVQDGRINDQYGEHSAGAYMDTDGTILYQQAGQGNVDFYISHYYAVVRGASYLTIHSAYSTSKKMVHVTTLFQV